MTEDTTTTAFSPTTSALMEAPHMPTLSITAMGKYMMQATMASMQAMASAQLKRFDAAGVLVMVFDREGTALQVLERPEHGAVTDDYMRESVAQLVGVNTTRERKNRRRK